MTHGPSGAEYKDIIVFLAAAGVLVPILNRFKISPVLGFLAAGVCWARTAWAGSWTSCRGSA